MDSELMQEFQNEEGDLVYHVIHKGRRVTINLIESHQGRWGTIITIETRRLSERSPHYDSHPDDEWHILETTTIQAIYHYPIPALMTAMNWVVDQIAIQSQK